MNNKTERVKVGGVVIDEDKQGEVVSEVMGLLDTYTAQMSAQRTDWLKSWQSTFVFKGERERGSNIFFPKAFEHVDNLASTIFGDNPKWKVAPILAENPMVKDTNMPEAARALQYGLHHFWNTQDLAVDAESVLRSGLGCDIGVAKVEMTQHIVEGEQEDINGDMVEIKKVIAEYPCFRSVDPLSVFFDTRVAKVDDLPCLIYKAGEIRKAQALANPDFFNKDQIKEASSQTEQDEFILVKNASQGMVNEEAEALTTGDVLTVVEYYGYLNLGDDYEEEALYKAVILNESILVHLKKIKFIPFEVFTPIIVPDQLVGRSVGSLLRDPQRAYNLTRNQRFDNVTMILSGAFKVKNGSGIDLSNVKLAAGHVIKVKDPDDVTLFQIPDVTGAGFAEAQSLSTEMQQATGVIDPTQASNQSSFTNTATGEAIRYQIFRDRTKKIRTNFERFLSRLGTKMLLILAEEERVKDIEVADERIKQFYRVASEIFKDVDAFFSIQVEAGSTVHDSIENKRDEMLAALQLGLALKGQGVNIDINYLASEIFSTFGGVDVGRLIQPQQLPQEGQEGGEVKGRPLPQGVEQQVEGVGQDEYQALAEQITKNL